MDIDYIFQNKRNLERRVIYLTILQISISGILEDCWILLCVSPFNLLQYAVFVQLCDKISSLYREVIVKGSICDITIC